MRSRLTAGFARAAVALAMLATVAFVAAPATEAANFRRIAETDQPGKWEFTGEGFRPGVEFTLRLLGPSGQNVKFGGKTANDRGRANFTVLVPRYFEPGTWTARLRGQTSDKEAEEAFELGYRPPDLALEVHQPAGPPGTTFVFTSRDFEPGEEVGYWLSGPGGQAIPGGAVVAEPDGGVAFTYTVPPDAQPGVWQMTAYGQSSDHQGVVAFTVEG
jgi:hypothetical protein